MDMLALDTMPDSDAATRPAAALCVDQPPATARKDLLRFLTCGSVDDGKSTLIGRLLHDSKQVYEDQLAAVRRDSVRFDTTGTGLDLALLVDGLQSEREQGITIDVAYRYFASDRRSFIIADTPGHAQYTRNMATGASTSSAAVILVDAAKGILTQTRRHSFIVSLLGIRHVVLAVNKMDTVGWDRGAYDAIRHSFDEFARRLGIDSIQAIPLSALTGDNVVIPSEAMDWYTGPTLLGALEDMDVEADRGTGPMRFPVQYVNRPSAGFRGYCGTLASGTLAPGDAVAILPSGRESRIARIIAWEGDQTYARAGDAVTVTLTDDLDVARGDMLTAVEDRPAVARAVEAHVVWMADAPLATGRTYDLRLATATVGATVTDIKHRVDVNTLDQSGANELGLNEIGMCRLRLDTPTPLDPYSRIPGTGNFVLIDRLTNATVGAGMVVQVVPEGDRSSTNITWHESGVTRERRASQKGQKPCVIWLTGLSGAGKSTLANALEQSLMNRGHHSYLLDGDNVRHGLNRDLGFSAEDRAENIRRIGEVAKLMADAGLIVITAFIAPFRADRAAVRAMLGDGEFIEVHVQAPLEVCEQRDPKGLYAKARSGAITNFTGISAPYEPPVVPDIVIDTAGTDVQGAVAILDEQLIRRGIVLPH